MTVALHSSLVITSVVGTIAVINGNIAILRTKESLNILTNPGSQKQLRILAHVDGWPGWL